MASLKGYVLSQAADQDLEEIFDYTLTEFGLQQAATYVAEFEELFLTLVSNPDLGRTRPEIKSGLRSFAKSSHVVFYRVLTDRILIVRVLHGSRDIPRFFQELP